MIEAPYEMANLFPKHTGLPFVVWISDHCVKVPSDTKANTLITVELNHINGAWWLAASGPIETAHFRQLARWLELHRDTLLKYWRGEIDTKDALDAIVSL